MAGAGSSMQIAGTDPFRDRINLFVNAAVEPSLVTPDAENAPVTLTGLLKSKLVVA